MKHLLLTTIAAVVLVEGVENRDEVEQDNWGIITTQQAEFYAARDVPRTQIDLTEEWYEIASNAWGNYGPLEFWIVGTNEIAASILDKKYCELRNQKDITVSIEHCVNRDHNFVSYAKGGNAGLNTRRNENEKWSGFIITMSAKFPSPQEEDYKPVVLHEYFHVYQHAHIHSKKHSERKSRNLENPWWSEGGAEYMAQLLYSKQKGVRPNYLREIMERKLRALKDIRDGKSIKDITYGERSHLAYDLGAWFIAFIINKTSEEAYRVNFYKDLNTKGFEGAFVKNFGASSDDLLEVYFNCLVES